jgi:hypothetical protein
MPYSAFGLPKANSWQMYYNDCIAHWKPIALNCINQFGLDLLPILPRALPSGSAVAVVGRRALEYLAVFNIPITWFLHEKAATQL